MNKQQRKSLDEAIELLEQAQEIINTIKDEEQEKFDNLSEGLQATENNQKLETNASTLENASASVDEVLEYINEAKDN